MNKHCFYCDANLTSDGFEKDHFPVPDRLGGTDLVDSCKTCHDMKDRFNVGSWSAEWVSRIVRDFPLLGRESRIFLAKSIDAMMEIQQREHDAK